MPGVGRPANPEFYPIFKLMRFRAKYLYILLLQ